MQAIWSQPVGDTLPREVLEHHLAGTDLVHRGRPDQRANREPGDVHGHDALGTLRAAERPLPSWKVATRLDAPRVRAPVPLRDQRRNCDHTRVQGPNDSGR
jgi:hypothetical protein